MQDQSQPSTAPLPHRLGIAADLVFIVPSPAEYLLNSLLVYEKVVLPIDFMVLGRLMSEFSALQLKRLAEAGRITFCPQVTANLALRKEPVEFSRADFLASLDKGIWHPDDKGFPLIDVIDANLLVGAYGDYAGWRELHDEAVDEFMHVAGRKGYEQLMPPNTLFSNRFDRLTGLETGLARMNDLVVAGVTDLQMDKELPVLLEVCFPAQQRATLVSAEAVERDAISAVENLHSIKGLPLLRPGYDHHEQDLDRCIEMVLSDEAVALRGWLKANWAPGLDVRDAYIRSESRLPSKKSWTGWLKFGAVTGVSTVVTGLIVDPLVGAAVGTGIGVLDQKFGQKSIEKMADTYHPSRWLSYVEASIPPGQAGS